MKPSRRDSRGSPLVPANKCSPGDSRDDRSGSLSARPIGSAAPRPGRGRVSVHQMRVAYLITSSGMGGAERQVCHLARAFHRRGWEVAAISMLPLERPVADLADDGIATLSLGMNRGVPDPRAIAALRRFLRSWRPDVLHAHMVHANLLARLTRLVGPVPVV